MLLDSPRLEAPAWFESAATPFARAIGLPALAQVLHIAIFTCLVSFGLQYLSSVLSPKLFPKYYPTLKAKRDDWDLHIVRRSGSARRRDPTADPTRSSPRDRSAGRTRSSQPLSLSPLS